MSGLSAWWTVHVLWWRGLSTSDLFAFLGIVATIVVAIVPALRASAKSMLNATFLRGGRDERRYAEVVHRAVGRLREPLSRRQGGPRPRQHLRLTVAVPAGLGPGDAHRVPGGCSPTGRAATWSSRATPGSGKSTLLKAYGVGALKSRRRPAAPAARARDDQIPFFVQLRKLAKSSRREQATASPTYMVDEVLVSGAGLTRADATEILRYSVGRRPRPGDARRPGRGHRGPPAGGAGGGKHVHPRPDARSCPPHRLESW